MMFRTQPVLMTKHHLNEGACDYVSTCVYVSVYTRNTRCTPLALHPSVRTPLKCPLSQLPGLRIPTENLRNKKKIILQKISHFFQYKYIWVLFVFAPCGARSPNDAETDGSFFSRQAGKAFLFTACY